MPRFRTGKRRAELNLRYFDLCERSRRFFERGVEVFTICQSNSLGTTRSALSNFDHFQFLPPDVRAKDMSAVAELLCAAEARIIVFNSLTHTYFQLIQEIKQVRGDQRIFMIWHGNFSQLANNYIYENFRLLMSLLADGLIERIGFVKAGMDEVFRSSGFDAYQIEHALRITGVDRVEPFEDGLTHVGIFSNFGGWRKNAFTQLLSLAALPDAAAHVIPISPEAIEIAGRYKIPIVTCSSEPIENADLLRLISRLHCTLNVTFSECLPILPAESLNLGVPSLVGPNTHLFDDDEFLSEVLVVPQPDRHECIAAHIERAAAAREEIVSRWDAGEEVRRRRAAALLEAFLSG